MGTEEKVVGVAEEQRDKNSTVWTDAFRPENGRQRAMGGCPCPSVTDKTKKEPHLTPSPRIDGSHKSGRFGQLLRNKDNVLLWLS